MNCRHAVCAVRAHYCQICHPNFSLFAFLNKTHIGYTSFIALIAASYIIEQATVYFVNYFKLTRQHQLEPKLRPLLQSFGQKCMVCVSQCALCNVPRLVPSEVSVIARNAHEFGYSHSRMCVIELYGNLLRKQAPVGVVAPEAPHEIGE